MNFSQLESCHIKWCDILSIGKTIERDGNKYHIMGMTLSDEVKLYIIEPNIISERSPKRGINNQRKMLKEREQSHFSYSNCHAFTIGSEYFEVQGCSSEPLTYHNNGTIQLFFDMMNAGWNIPEWLKNIDWDNLILLTLNITNTDKLPIYSPDMLITITHRADNKQHLLEKSITLTVGKNRSISFTDSYGDDVQCHINHVKLIDIWKKTEEDFNDPKYQEKLPPERIKELKETCFRALEQNCPKGMCYIYIEYECSKDLQLVFYTKQFLKSGPIIHTGNGSHYFMMFRLKPDKKIGTHSLPLKSCVIQYPISPDTIKIPSELFLYYEKINQWTETIDF